MPASTESVKTPVAPVAPAPIAAPPVVRVPNVALKDAKNIPQVADMTNIPIANDDAPLVSEYAGRYTHKSDGEDYALCVRENDPRGKTHKLLNSVHFWEGNETEFRLTFEKK